MKRYLRIYRKMAQVSVLYVMEYRSYMFYGALLTLLWSSLNIVTILLLTRNVKAVYGWSREELVVLVAMYNIFSGFFYFFFSNNIGKLPDKINRGSLDLFLLKPMDSQFSVSMYESRIYHFARSVVFSIVTGIILVNVLHVHVGLFNILGAFVFLLLNVALLYSVWFMIITLTIWSPEVNNLINILFQSNSIMKYPPGMYRPLGEIIAFLILPFTIIISVPTRILLNKVTVQELIVDVGVCIVLFIASRLFWKFALRSYTSASG